LPQVHTIPDDKSDTQVLHPQNRFLLKAKQKIHFSLRAYLGGGQGAFFGISSSAQTGSGSETAP
jgi:hypothetical protein